ncbi:MAG: protein kinase [Pseudomonadota bacterium]
MTVKFGKYELLEHVGSNAVTEVFKARATGAAGFQKIVALKRLLPQNATDQTFVSSFITKAQLAAALSHTNIVQVFEAGEVNNIPFMVMEYVHGKNLMQIHEQFRGMQRTMPFPLAIHIVLAVCNGLEYAHNKRDTKGQPLRIIHGGVCPKKIVISSAGAVKLFDFGMTAGTTKKTSASDASAIYMPPEQKAGKKLDRFSDLFSLGVVLYECVTGQSLCEEADSSPQHNVKPPSQVNPLVHKALENILLKTLESDPKNRYQRAKELHQELESFAKASRQTFTSKQLSRWMKNSFGTELDTKTPEPSSQSADRRDPVPQTAKEPAPPQSTDEPTPVALVNQVRPRVGVSRRRSHVSQPTSAQHESTPTEERAAGIDVSPLDELQEQDPLHDERPSRITLRGFTMPVMDDSAAGKDAALPFDDVEEDKTIVDGKSPWDDEPTQVKSETKEQSPVAPGALYNKPIDLAFSPQLDPAEPETILPDKLSAAQVAALAQNRNRTYAKELLSKPLGIRRPVWFWPTIIGGASILLICGIAGVYLVAKGSAENPISAVEKKSPHLIPQKQIGVWKTPPKTVPLKNDAQLLQDRSITDDEPGLSVGMYKKPHPIKRHEKGAITKSSMKKLNWEKRTTQNKTSAPVRTAKQQTRPKSLAPKSTSKLLALKQKSSTPKETTKPGYLIVASRPSSAKVYVDSKPTGRKTPISPNEPLKLLPGKHQITLVLGNKKFHFPVTVQSGQTTRLIKPLPIGE